MLDPFIVGAPDAERDHPGHILDDVADAILNGGVRRIETNGHVAAAGIEADAGNADLLFIGDNATDRLRTAKVAVGADDAGNRVADRHAVLHLRNRGLVMLAKDLERTIPVLR